MKTSAKLNICCLTAGAILFLSVFSKPLEIPDTFQAVLLIGAGISCGMMVYFTKKLKQEKLALARSGNAASQPTAESRKKIKNQLILLMAIGVVIGLSAPLWLPVTGTTSGTVSDLVCGLIMATIICIIFGLRLRKLRG